MYMSRSVNAAFLAGVTNGSHQRLRPQQAWHGILCGGLGLIDVPV